jgi:hypothetical protein
VETAQGRRLRRTVFHQAYLVAPYILCPVEALA